MGPTGFWVITEGRCIGVNRVQLAAGGVVSRRDREALLVAIVHRPKYLDWSIPKGKQDPGETLDQTALREVREETAVDCELGMALGTREYPGKLVHYWEMKPRVEHRFVPSSEIDDLKWIPLEEVKTWLTHEQDRTLIDDFCRLRKQF